VVVRGRVTTRMAVGVATLAALLVGCSGGSGDSEASGADAGTVSEAADTARTGSARGGSAPAGAPGRAAVQPQLVISTARVHLAAADLEGARDELDGLLGAYGGHVATEQTTKDDDGEAERSELELRVPARHFDRLMADLEELGTVSSSNRERMDVTDEVIDVESRIRTQEVSLDRLRGFLGEATDVNAMIRLEGEIARREADLASLRGQQEYLEDQTSLATIMLTMTRDHPDAPPDVDPLDGAGFLSGLRGGWEALVSALVVGATVVGAVLPFAVVLGLLGVPVWLWVRRRRPVAPSETTAA
jgi:hypothetical protein